MAGAPTTSPSLATAVLRIGTRGSRLALAQASIVAEALARAGVRTELHAIETEGDRRPPDTAWGEGAFVGTIEAALLEGSIDIAVHSAKDLPTDEDPRLRVAAFLPRADPLDVLVVRGTDAVDGGPPVFGDRGASDGATADEAAGRSPFEAVVDALPAGARIGTDSPRRTGFLRAVRGDLAFHPLHGNVDTRLRRLDEGETDVLVLAAAGLSRLRLADRIAARIPADVLPPAPGQGALAVQVRASAADVMAAVAAIDHGPTRTSVEAERALLAATGGGCRTPVGALATTDGQALELLAGFAPSNGQPPAIARAGGSRDDLEPIVRQVLDELADRGADPLVASGAPAVIVATGEETSAPVRLALVDRGLVPLAVPAIEVDQARSGELVSLLVHRPPWDWVVVTSANAVRALAIAARSAGVTLLSAPGLDGARWAAVGRSTANALRMAGIALAHRPREATGSGLAESVPVEPASRVLLPRSDIADDRLPRRLLERGARVETVVAYRTLEAPRASRPLLVAALAREPRAVAVSSPSTVRGILRLAEDAGAVDALRAVRFVAIGPSTAAELRRVGIEPAATANNPGPGGLADATLLAIQTTTEDS